MVLSSTNHLLCLAYPDHEYLGLHGYQDHSSNTVADSDFQPDDSFLKECWKVTPWFLSPIPRFFLRNMLSRLVA